MFQILSSEATAPNIIAGGEMISQDVLAEAQALKATRAHLIHLPSCYIAALLTSVQAGEREFEETELDLAANVDLLPNLDFAWKEVTSDALALDAVTTAADYREPEIYREPETYDERMLRLRRGCRRLMAWIAGELGASAIEIEQYYRKHLGFGQIGATLAQMEYKHDVLRRKAGELQSASGGLGS